MEGGAGDFHDDWELLHDDSDSDSDSPVEAEEEPHRGLGGIEDDSGGMIRPDYFSIDGSKLYAKPLLPSEDAADSAESDNPSWVDPGSDLQFAGRNPHRELWSDSGRDLSEERGFSDFGPVEIKKEPLRFEGVGFGFDGAKLGDFDVESEVARGGFEDLGEIRAADRDSGDQLGAEQLGADESSGAEQKDPRGEAESSAVDKVRVGGEEGRRIAWWKVPFEVLRYCVLRVGPVWSFSVAAAVVGLVVLGRRLHKMKQKSRTLQLKVTLDDKKVALFKSRAARLNEAFSVVKRVPIVRPALPSPAAASWPMMSLR